MEPEIAAPIIPRPSRAHELGALRGAALYVGALIGPGVLLIPSLAAQTAGPAAILAWIGLIVLSLPLAITFAALGKRYPVAGGVAAYAKAAFGKTTGGVVGSVFMTAIILGAPGVSVIGGYYIADLTGAGTHVADLSGCAMFFSVLVLNALGLRVSSGAQILLSGILFVIIAGAVIVALPTKAQANWHPFAPHGWLNVGVAASILIWLFVGWEAVAQLVSEFRDPDRDLPRAMTAAFTCVTLLYVGLALVTIGLAKDGLSRVPLADLIAVGLGERGRQVTALLAVALTMGTMNVYQGGGARLAAALADEGALPRAWVEANPPTIPRRPLMIVAGVGAALFAALFSHALTANELIRATSACFVIVYVATTAAACSLLRGYGRATAAVAFALVTIVAVFSGWNLLVPATAASLALAYAVFRHQRRPLR